MFSSAFPGYGSCARKKKASTSVEHRPGPPCRITHSLSHTHTSQAITVWQCQERQQIWVLESVGLTVELEIDVKKHLRDGGMEGNLDIKVEQITSFPFFCLQHKHLCHIQVLIPTVKKLQIIKTNQYFKSFYPSCTLYRIHCIVLHIQSIWSPSNHLSKSKELHCSLKPFQIFFFHQCSCIYFPTAYKTVFLLVLCLNRRQWSFLSNLWSANVCMRSEAE